MSYKLIEYQKIIQNYLPTFDQGNKFEWNIPVTEDFASFISCDLQYLANLRKSYYQVVSFIIDYKRTFIQLCIWIYPVHSSRTPT